jgi:hypothetical protein
MSHISDHDLERYHLGMATGSELAKIEKHLLTCSQCIDAAEEAAQYVDAMRAASISLGCDVTYDTFGSRKKKC